MPQRAAEGVALMESVVERDPVHVLELPLARQPEVQVPVIHSPKLRIESAHLVQRRSADQGLSGGQQTVLPEKRLIHVPGRMTLGRRRGDCAVRMQARGRAIDQHGLGLFLQHARLPLQLPGRPQVVVV